MLKQLNRYRDIYNIYKCTFSHICLYYFVCLFVVVAAGAVGGGVVAVVGTAAAALWFAWIHLLILNDQQSFF